MLNYIWLTMIILAIVLGGINGKIENGDVTKAAKALNISRATLYRRLKQLGDDSI